MKRLLLSAAALALLSVGAPPPPAAAGPDLCRVYCESIYAGCLVTFGHINPDWCEEWREGCREGCERK